MFRKSERGSKESVRAGTKKYMGVQFSEEATSSGLYKILIRF